MKTNGSKLPSGEWNTTILNAERTVSLLRELGREEAAAEVDDLICEFINAQGEIDEAERRGFKDGVRIALSVLAEIEGEGAGSAAYMEIASAAGGILELYEGAEECDREHLAEAAWLHDIKLPEG